MPLYFRQNSFGLTPKIFDSIDMFFPFRKMRRVIDAMMLEVVCIKGIARAAAVGANNAVRLDFPCNQRHQGARTSIFDNARQ